MLKQFAFLTLDPGPPIMRARRAKMMVWLLLSHPPEPANCANTGDQQAILSPLSPVRPYSIDDNLMYHGIFTERRQIERRFSHVEWIDFLAPENLFRRRIDKIVGHATRTNGAHFYMMRTAFVGQ